MLWSFAVHIWVNIKAEQKSALTHPLLSSLLDAWSGFTHWDQSGITAFTGIPLVSMFHEKSMCSLCFLFFAFKADFYLLYRFNDWSNRTDSVLMFLGDFFVLQTRSQCRAFVPNLLHKYIVWLIDYQKLWQAAPSASANLSSGSDLSAHAQWGRQTFNPPPWQLKIQTYLDMLGGSGMLVCVCVLFCVGDKCALLYFSQWLINSRDTPSGFSHHGTLGKHTQTQFVVHARTSSVHARFHTQAARTYTNTCSPPRTNRHLQPELFLSEVIWCVCVCECYPLTPATTHTFTSSNPN